MAKIKILCDNALSFNAQEIANSLLSTLNQTGNVSVELSIVDQALIQSVNKKFRNIDAVTDVLSFPTLDDIRYKNITASEFPLDLDESGNAVFIGSIIICKERAINQAKEFNHSLERELGYLFCHGLLHLFGYDHMTDEDDLEMRELASTTLNKINLTR